MIVKYNRHWKQTRLKYLFKIKKGVLPKFLEIEKGEDNYPYLSMKVLRGQKPNEFAKRNNCIFAVEGDIGILWDGSNAGEILKINVNGILSSTISLLKVKAIELDQGYAFYILKSYENFFKNNTVGMGIPHVDGNFLKNNHLPKPPLEEQKMISRYLDKKTLQIDLLVEKIQKKIELLKEQRTSLINQCVTKGLNPNVEMKDSNIEWIGKIPKHWDVKKLKYVSKQISERRLPVEGEKKISPENVESETGFINNYFSEYDTEGKIFKHGDILFNKLRVYLNKVVLCDFEGLSMGEMIVIRPTNISNAFLHRVLNAYGFINHVNSLSEGVKLPRPSVDDIFNSFIPIPPDQEQVRIIKAIKLRVNFINEIISKIVDQLNVIQEFRQSLISSVVTGKIRITKEMI